MKNSAKFTLSALALLTLGGCSDSNTSSGDPRRSMTNDMSGYRAQHGVMAANDYQYYWINQAASGWRRGISMEFPTQFEDLYPVRNCNFRRKTQDEVVKLAHVTSSKQTTAVQRVSNEAIAKSAKIYVRSYQSEKKAPQIYPNDYDSLKMVDVVVTEALRPVYLVLTSRTKVLWNIHPAKGVKISHIAVVGSDEAAIANVPEGTTVEALYGKAREKCKVRPFRKPADHWTFVQNVKNGDGIATKKDLARNKNLHAKFDNWIRKQFGISASKGAVQINQVSHVLIGEVPEDGSNRAPYKSIAGASVHMSPEDHVFVGNRNSYAKEKRSLVRDFVEKRLKISLAALGG